MNKTRVSVFIDGSNFYFKMKSLDFKNLSRFDYRGFINWLARIWIPPPDAYRDHRDGNDNKEIKPNFVIQGNLGFTRS